MELLERAQNTALSNSGEQLRRVGILELIATKIEKVETRLLVANDLCQHVKCTFSISVTVLKP